MVSDKVIARGRVLIDLLRRNKRAIRDALVLLGLLRMVWYYAVQGIHPWEWAGLDARAYWRIDLAHPYAGSALGLPTTFLYSPVFAQLTAPLGLIPWPLFYLAWAGTLVAITWWLVRPWPWALAILALPISYEILMGNVHLLLAAMIAIGFSRPAVWAFALLTKITPGIGLVWFAVRGDTRGFMTAVGFAVGLAGISFLIAPQAWADWVSLLRNSTGGAEALVPRVILATMIVVAAALAGRPWLVPVAVCLAMPVVWVNSYCVLLAMVRLVNIRAAPIAVAGRSTAPGL